MNFDVQVTSNFKKQTKRLIRKCPSLKDEVDELISTLMTNPEQGSDLGRGVLKSDWPLPQKEKVNPVVRT